MKSRLGHEVVVFLAVILSLTSVSMPVVAAEITRISTIDDSYIGKEVTVSGVVLTISNNIPETGTIQTYDPGGISVLKIDDGSGTLLVSSDPRLLDDVYEGLRIMARGLYAGDGIIYADMVGEDIADIMTGATAVAVQSPEPEATPSPTPTPSATPTPVPTPTPYVAPTMPLTPLPTDAGGKKGALPLYIIVIIIAAVVLAGIIIGVKVKEKYMRKQE